MKAKTKRAPNTGKTQTKNASPARRQQTIELIHKQNAFLYENQRMLLALFSQLHESQKSNTQLDQIVIRHINALDIKKSIADLDYLANTLYTAAQFTTTELTASVDALEKIDEWVLRAAARIDVKPIRKFAETLQRDLVSAYINIKEEKK